MKEKIGKITDILFEALVFYVFFIMSIFSIEIGVMYKLLGIAGIFVSIVIILINKFNHKEK